MLQEWWKRLLAAILLSAAAGVAGCGPRAETAGSPFMHGMIYAGNSPDVYSTPISDGLIRELRSTHTDWLIVTPKWYQTNLSATGIASWNLRSPTDASVRHVVRLAHHLGMKVMLMPLDGLMDGSSRTLIQPSNWGAWFQSYTAFIDHYAELGAAERSEGFTVGSGYSKSDATHTGAWRKVIRSVRRRFKGLLTYAADWSQYQKIRFWDDLDAIGIDAYFPLAAAENPGLSTLERSWRPWMREVTTFLGRHPGKRVIFSEIGYMSRVGSAIDPSQHLYSAPAAPELQARLYESVFKTVYREPWLQGLCWYWWDNPSVPDYPAGPTDTGYTPRRKPAEAVLRYYFGTPRRVFNHAV